MTGNEATLAVVDALEACSIPYMIVGSYSGRTFTALSDPLAMPISWSSQLREPSADLSRRLPPAIRINRRLGF